MTEYASRHFLAGDRPLRRDIRLLGWQVRRLVLEHGGREVWDLMHELRVLAEQRHVDAAAAEARIIELLRRTPTEQFPPLVQAARLFFDLANLAEDRHRVRVLRRRHAEGRASETIDEAAATLRREGATGEELRELFGRLQIEPVLTAHPTEAKRRTIRRALRRLRRDLYLIDRPRLLRSERRQRLERMQRDLASLWYTDPLSPRKPTVMEELDRTLFAVRTLWRVGPRLMRKVRRSIGEFTDAPPTDRPMLSFGNWIGGDRDGNPFVTAEVTRSALAKLRGEAVDMHRRQCRMVRERLTISAARCELPASLREAIDAARRAWPNVEKRLDVLHPDEWLVHWLTVIDYRLAHSADLPDGPEAGANAATNGPAYRNADELARDVQRLYDALHAGGHDELIGGALQRWRDRIGMFGLHLMRLDLRVNSKAIEEAVDAIRRAAAGEGLADGVDRNGAAYPAMDDAQRRAALRDMPPATAAGVDPGGLGDDVADLMRALRLYQRVAEAGCAESLGQVIISMTHRPTDVIAMVWLMNVAAAAEGHAASAAIPVVPLFETIDDLDRADGMLESLLADPMYRDHVDHCRGRQTCMIGYSDSAKDGGYLASNWGLYETQKRLVEVARRHGVTLTIFHGRGGALGRGGGPAAHAILSLPPEAVDGRFRITEQGEIIAERYDDPVIAERHLEQLMWGTLMVSRRGRGTPPEGASELAERLAERSLASYRDLTGQPGFVDYLRHCTALPLVEALGIGSRPSRRDPAAGIDQLRAIPFTFAWNQVRVPINAFYGLGSAFDALSDAERQRASHLYEQWSWFRAIIDNAELALARCDPAIARRYLPLAPDPGAAEALWRALRDEHQRAVTAVLAIKREDRLIDHVPWLRRTIRVRTPYLDVLNLIQVELLQRRGDAANDEAVDAIDEGLRQSVQAIASGLRNTG